MQQHGVGAAAPAVPLDASRAIARRAILGSLAGAAGVAALSSVARAGPLTPPAGSVSPTGKTLSDIEPRKGVNATNTPGDSGAVYVLTAPGSYYLTGNVNVPAGKAGVRIAASSVKLDLCGFRVSGGGTTGSVGITDGGAARADIEVRNGSVVSMGAIGVSLSTTERASVSDVNVCDNGGLGVLAGPRAVVSRVFAKGNAGSQGALAAGIRAGDESAARGCVAWSNTGAGIAVGQNGQVEECVAVANTGNGIDTYSTTAAIRCLVAGNGGTGIVGGSAIVSCAAGDNISRGIATTRAAIVGCASRNNQGTNISAGGGSTVRFCAASLTFSPSFTAHGYELGATSVIADSSAYSNAGNGIQASQHCNISGCVARRNANDGIAVTSGTTVVLENTCTDNGTLGPNAGGIRVAGPGNRVEGNLCAGQTGFGVWVTSQENLVLRNSSSSNQVNYSIFSNCVFGTVVDRTNPGVSGMSGNGTVASTVGTTDPFANVAF
jgi:parallel beta-helix repeat protein